MDYTELEYDNDDALHLPYLQIGPFFPEEKEHLASF